MAKSYLAEKSAKKKIAMKGVWFIVIVAIIFITIIVKYALSGSTSSFTSGMPSNDDAYQVAKDFIRPTIKSDADFPESGYQFGKKTDSVYIIKSYYEEKVEGGDKSKRNYEIVMKYNGGNHTNKNNWSIVNLDTNL